MYRHRYRRALLIVLSWTAEPALAEQVARIEANPSPPVENIVVTASNEPHDAWSLPATIDVVPSAEIRSLRPVSLTDVLRHRAGLHIDQPGARGGRSSVYTRGLDPNHTLVMFDGIPLNNETNARGGSFDFSTLTAIDIDRVEILRGPISAVYGSAAMAGAINIIPRRGQTETEASVEMSGGGDGYGRGRATLSGANGPIDLSLGGSYTDESNPGSIGTYRGGEFLTHMGLQLSESAELRGTLRYADSRSEAFPDFSGGNRLAVNRDREKRDTEEMAGAIRLRHEVGPRFHYSARFNIYHNRENRSTPAVFASAQDPLPAVPGEPDTRQRYLRYSAAIKGTVEIVEDIELTIGADAYREDGSSRGDVDFGAVLPGFADFDLDRSVGAPFTEVFWNAPFGVTLLAGLRVDLPEGRSEEFLPRVGASYILPTLLTNLHASWGQGFKLPSFFALASPLAGNSELRPERSRGYDISARQLLWDDRVDVRLTYFDIAVSGLIDFNPESFRLENLDSAQTRGGELEMTVSAHADLDVRVHTTYLDASGTSAATGDSERLRNRPRWRGGIGLTWTPLDDVEAHLQALFVGDTLDTSAPTGDAPIRVSGYHRLDLAIAWRPIDHLTMYLAIDNLTDTDYEEIIGFPAIGIRPRAGIEISL